MPTAGTFPCKCPSADPFGFKQGGVDCCLTCGGALPSAEPADPKELQNDGDPIKAAASPPRGPVCEICDLGPPTDRAQLWRINGLGKTGRWVCECHAKIFASYARRNNLGIIDPHMAAKPNVVGYCYLTDDQIEDAKAEALAG